MKSIDMFCASPASTAICSSMEQRAIVRHGMRPVDRQIHRLGETPRSRTNAAPCSSQLPYDPSYHKTRKITTCANKQTEILQRKSSADRSSRYNPFLNVITDSESALVSRDGFPASSTRNPAVYEPSSNTAQIQKKPSGTLTDNLNNHQKSSVAQTNCQVVELRVSIHCKGCQGKLRKHISRMEGVASFSIDLERKKVTVMGNVTPLGVLTSISKVKNAQFWPSPTSSLSSSSPRVSLAR